VYAVLVLTVVGRRVDVGSFRLLSALTGPLGAEANEFREVMPFVLAVLVVVLGTLALRRRRWRETIRSLIFVVASFSIAEALKQVLPRPGAEGLTGIFGNSYPSGHVAITLALALVAVILSPSDRWHIWLACATGAVVIGVAWCSVISSAHRPSDVIGSALLVGFLVQVVFWRRIAMVDSRPRLARVLIFCAGAGLVLVVIAAGVYTTGSPAGAFAAGILGWLLLCAAPAAYAVMLAPTGPLSLLERGRA